MITTAQNSAEAIEKAGENRFDLFMLDVRLPDGNGEDLALTLHKMQPSAPIIYYTASGIRSPEARGNGEMRRCLFGKTCGVGGCRNEYRKLFNVE